MRKKEKQNKKRQTLVSVILRELAVCLIVIAAGIFLIYIAGNKICDNFWERTDISYLLSQKENLRSEKYDKIVDGGGYNYSGYFEIADSRADVIYCSNSEKHNRYNAQALSFIPDSKTDESIYMEQLTKEDDSRFLITRYSVVNGESQLTGIMMIGDDGRIDYDSIGIAAGSLNRKTIDILKKNSDCTFLQKRKFITDNGETRYLLYHVGNRNRLYRTVEDRIWDVTIIASILLAVISVMMFCFRLVRKFRDPMENFIGKMKDFGETRKVNVASEDTDGPQEFRSIMISLGILERRLVESEEERRKMEAQRQQMLTDISHDLRTPAAVIQGYSEILAGGKSDPEKQKQYINIIRNRSENLTDMINTFFEYSKLNYPGMRPDFEKDDFCEFFREYFADRFEELDAQGSTVTAEIPEETMVISFDHLLMKRMIGNIINNSVRHNGGRVDFYAGLSQSDSEIIIRIGDNGKGISSELRENVFSPFVTGNKARTGSEGTGLGLAIAEKIAELHHGTIRLLPEGKGGWKVLFEIRLKKVTSDF